MCAASAERWPEAQYRITLLERLGCEGGAVAGGAVEHDPPRSVPDRALDARLQVAARHVDGAGQVARLELVLLAHVDENGTVAVLLERVDVGRVDLVDLLRRHVSGGPVVLDAQRSA